jgi:hypothetical protein
MLKTSLKGMRDMQTRLKKVATVFPDRVRAAVRAEAEIEMTESKKRVPVDRGFLRASGHVVMPQRGTGRIIYVDLVYGGVAEAYAVYVHEDPFAFHKVGQWKYLESVLNESAPFIGQRLAHRLQLDRVDWFGPAATTIR